MSIANPWNSVIYSSDVTVEYKKLDAPQMAECEYCRSGYDHATFGNCPQCGAPSSEPMLKGMVMLKGITADDWAQAMVNREGIAGVMKKIHDDLETG